MLDFYEFFNKCVIKRMKKFALLSFLILLLSLWLPIQTCGLSEHVDINTAPLEELQRLDGIGPVLAQRIIEARPFYSLDDLIEVNRIGPKILENIKKQGLAWVDPELTSLKDDEQKQLPTKNYAPAKRSSQETKKSPIVFLVAFGLAGFSGIAVLTLKKKLKIG